MYEVNCEVCTIATENYFPTHHSIATLDELEEKLYILFELEPKDRDWKRILFSGNPVIFTYHGVAPVRARLHGNKIYLQD